MKTTLLFLATAFLGAGSVAVAQPFEDEPNNTFGTANALPVQANPEDPIGAMQGDFFDGTGFRDDFFSFECVAGATYVVLVQNNGTFLSFQDVGLIVYDPSQTQIGIDDSGGNEADESVTFTAATTGTHYALVYEATQFAATAGYIIRVDFPASVNDWELY